MNCKNCGKKGIGGIQHKGSQFINIDDRCSFCGGFNLHGELTSEYIKNNQNFDIPANRLEDFPMYSWNAWKENNLIKKNGIYKKKLSNLLSMKYKKGISFIEYYLESGKFSINDIVKICNSDKKLNFSNIDFIEQQNSQDIEIEKNKKIKREEKLQNAKLKVGSSIDWIYNLIPETIWGILFYAVVIILCIIFLGDNGYEQGPRFFGDPG